MKSRSDAKPAPRGYTRLLQSLRDTFATRRGAKMPKTGKARPDAPALANFEFWHSRFAFGDIVQRCNRKDGTRPPYRFRGLVVGSYFNPETGESGANIASFAEPGCVQLFPDYMLEPASIGTAVPVGDEIAMERTQKETDNAG